MQYLNEFLIEVVSLEIEIVPVKLNKELNDEELGELELNSNHFMEQLNIHSIKDADIEFKSIDLSHYKEYSTTYKNRLEHLRLRSQTEILLLNETGILYQLNRIYIIKEVLSSFLKECNEAINSINDFPRNKKGGLLKIDNEDFDSLEMIIIDLFWYMRETLILSLPENKIPYGLNYTGLSYKTIF